MTIRIKDKNTAFENTLLKWSLMTSKNNKKNRILFQDYLLSALLFGIALATMLRGIN
ncbi:hypothetical protein [Gelidibacter algens]|uniref:hypothetical protein n=1 Tax=Gelidibacter algens TaxID=49280 RepID=UPI0012F85451|nr:hypothetical protein [Gelidibacter algens]